MIHFKIDKQTCTRCHACIQECPADVLAMGEESALIARPDLCVNCGHCCAICPTGALIPDESAYSVHPVPSDLPESQRLFHEKRSIRAYKNQPLSQALIQDILIYGDKAPSGHNFRNRGFCVVTDSEKIQKLESLVIQTYKPLVRLLKPWLIRLVALFSQEAAHELNEYALSFQELIRSEARGESPVFRGAPCVICVTAPAGSSMSRDDCAAAQHYMMLYAHTRGVSSCIIGYAEYAHKKLEKALNIPKGQNIFSVSIFGYGKHTYKKEVKYGKPRTIWA